MAWIEVHQALISHRKLRHFARLLNVRRAYAVGHLVCLWTWALDNAQDGDLTAIDERDIKEAADWPKKASTFTEAMVAAGLLDDDGGQLLIHDWDEYAGRLLTQRAANAERMRAKRDAARAANGSSTSVPHVQGLPDQPDPTVHNRPAPAPDRTASGAARAADESPTADPLQRCIVAYDGLMGTAATTPPLLKQMTDWLDSMESGVYDGAAWFEDACNEAALNNGRNLKYVLAILKRWQKDGRTTDDRRRPAPLVSGLGDAAIPGVRGIDWEEADARREHLAPGES